jgi:hypothetical protein
MPVTTRRQARQAEQAQQVHRLSHTNLNNLPAEILQEIADHLDPNTSETESDDSSEFSDDDYEWMSVTSQNPEDGPPEVKVMPCCRPGDNPIDADEPRIPVLDERSIFATTSRRIRDVVFNRAQKRRRTIRYCDKWIQETLELSEATRSRYT